MAEWSKVAVLKTDRTKHSHEFESRFTREKLNNDMGLAGIN